MEMAFSLIHSGAEPAAGQIADVFAQTAGFDHFGGGQQDAAVVHAGAQVQDRRDTHGFADFGQARTAVTAADSGVSRPSMAQAMPLQPVVSTMTSFLISSLTTVMWASLWRVRALLQPTTPAMPRMRPLMMLSLRV
jgi:hypothetical protein